MCITIYANPDQPTSTATVQQFINAGLGVSVYSPQRDAEKVQQAGIQVFPSVVACTTVGRFVWEGHRPDLIEMLADVFETGLVPAEGLHDQGAAEEAVLTRAQALSEIRDHQIDPTDFLAECGDQPLYRGKTVLDWLGY